MNGLGQTVGVNAIGVPAAPQVQPQGQGSTLASQAAVLAAMTNSAEMRLSRIIHHLYGDGPGYGEPAEKDAESVVSSLNSTLRACDRIDIAINNLMSIVGLDAPTPLPR